MKKILFKSGSTMMGGLEKVQIEYINFLLEQKKYDEMQQYLSLVEDESSINYLKGIAAMGLGKYDEAEYLKSTYHKQLTKQVFYKYITIRNGKTYEKIADILEGKG